MLIFVLIPLIWIALASLFAWLLGQSVRRADASPLRTREPVAQETVREDLAS